MDFSIFAYPLQILSSASEYQTNLCNQRLEEINEIQKQKRIHQWKRYQSADENKDDDEENNDNKYDLILEGKSLLPLPKQINHSNDLETILNLKNLSKYNVMIPIEEAQQMIIQQLKEYELLQKVHDIDSKPNSTFSSSSSSSSSSSESMGNASESSKSHASHSLESTDKGDSLPSSPNSQSNDSSDDNSHLQEYPIRYGKTPRSHSQSYHQSHHLHPQQPTKTILKAIAKDMIPLTSAITSSNIFQIPYLKEEIFWELRIPKILPPMNQSNDMIDSKLFFFGNILWRMIFGINYTIHHKIYYYFFVSPAEKLLIDCKLKIDFFLHPLASTSSSSMASTSMASASLASTSLGSTSTSLLTSTATNQSSIIPPFSPQPKNSSQQYFHLQLPPQQQHDILPIYIKSNQQNYHFPKEYNVSRGFDMFISHDEIQSYLSLPQQKIMLSIVLSSNKGPNGELIGAITYNNNS